MDRIPCILLCGCLAACSGSAGSGGIASDAGDSVSTWIALDLDTGRVEPVVIDPARMDPSDWRGARILFRRMAPTAGDIGRPVGDQLTEVDERPRRHASTGTVWMGAFELTQAQWLRLAGTTPWNEVLPFGDRDRFVAATHPAFGLSPEAVEDILPAWSRDGWRLDLPDPVEWEFACLAGADGKFSWGNDPDAAPSHAVCDPSGSGHQCPDAVGSRLPNAWNLYDMHGGVWEIVRGRDGFEARGGAWDQPPLICRASNHLELAHDTAGWTVGARLVLRR